MKKSIIREIFYGNRGHYETIKTNEKYKEILDKVVLFDEGLRKSLTEEQLKLYENTNNSIEELHSESIDNHFIEGFKLGLLIGIEVCDV